MNVDDQFAAQFTALTSRPPLKWQVRLFDRLVAGKIPSVVTLPTGLGKTSVIPIWLIALAHPGRANAGRPPLPRRLVYVVNRRTVVDQATDAAERIRRILANPSDAEQLERVACRLRDALMRMSGDSAGVPLAVSTLRGELADNGEWKQNPARPAIIIGTVDMIGSKLLFSGYGDGRYERAHHAGLIGQDALIAHDEAHLSPAFDALLRTVAPEQVRCKETRPVHVMSLSATGRAVTNGGAAADSDFRIEDEDRRDPLVSQRLNASKSLTIVEVEKNKANAEIATQALTLGNSPARVLVYVRSPENASVVAKAIEMGLGNGGGARVALLTGTIRGFERDVLAAGPILSSFWSNPSRQPLAQSMFLVSTSAGEVGADFDADHLVCDLTTLDSMAQRFGRVNRLGGAGRSAGIVVVTEKSAAGNAKEKKPSPFDAAVAKTGKILQTIVNDGGDVSPAALGAAIDRLTDEQKRAAFSPTPTNLPATDILFDGWALTSIGLVKGSDGRWRDALPGRPAVEPYLHGVAEWEPPETHVTWRADIAWLAAAGGKDDNGANVPCSNDELEQVFEVFPLRSAEQLRDRTDRVQAALRKIAERLNVEGQRQASYLPADDTASEKQDGTGNEDEGADDAATKTNRPIEPNPWIVLIRRGEPAWRRLEDLAPADQNEAKEAQRELAFATVVLPVELGGLSMNGMLDGDEPARQDAMSLDVAEMTGAGQRSRQRVLVHADDSEETLLGGKIDESMPTRERLTLQTGEQDGEAPAGSAIVAIEYRVQKGDAGEPGSEVGMHEHNAAVAAAAGRIATVLGLPDDLIRALELAGKHHDAGKSRAVWQWYARNHDPTRPLAKNKRYRDPRSLRGYRHEFGSLHDAEADAEISALDSDARDLVLHLIAAHHGWGRPHFEPRHFDPGDPGKPRLTADNERMAVEVMQRFGRLQQRYGRWGLAWLESLLRCADAEASASAAQSESSCDREGAGSEGSAGASPANRAPAGSKGGGE